MQSNYTIPLISLQIKILSNCFDYNNNIVKKEYLLKYYLICIYAFKFPIMIVISKLILSISPIL